DEVGAAIAVDVSGYGGASAEAFTRGLAREREEPAAVFAGVQVDASGSGRFAAIREIGGEDVGDAVAIQVARDGDEHRAQRLSAFFGIEGEGGSCGERPVNISAAVTLRSRLRRADDEHRAAFAAVTRDRRAEAIASPFAAEFQQQRAVA